MSERPAAVGAPQAGAFEDMLRIIEELGTPDGYRAELIRREDRRVAVVEAALPASHVEAAQAGGGSQDADWLDKLDTYGRVVPVYLVLDMQVEEITAFWDPSAKGYRSRTTVPFGKPLHVPAPFDFELDTSGFATHPNADADE